MADFPASAGGIRVVRFETIGSTNAEALTRAGQLEQTPLWIVAGRQTAGRGRRGRPWISEPGNLYASLLLFDPAPASATPGICFVAALALHDALLDAVHGLSPAQLALKWPNDLLLEGRKVAGILVEGATGSGRAAVVVGFGVNCRHHPEGTDYPATDLQTAGLPVEPGALLEKLGRRMSERLAEWNRGRNFAAIREAWLGRAYGMGGSVEVRLDGRAIAGRFEAIDDAGGMILRRDDGAHETISTGDVFALGGSRG